MSRLTGLWVYQRFGRPDPETVAEQAQRHGLRWLTAEAIEGEEVLNRDWLHGMRRATKKHNLRLGVHGYVGRPRPKPTAEAKAMVKAIDIAEADFAIVNAEIQYEQSPSPVSREFVEEYRRLKPDFPSYLSSFGRPEFHASLDWNAWAKGGFRGMPQAYENLNARLLKPAQCVEDWDRFFPRDSMRPTLGCFAESNHLRLPVTRLVQSVRDIPDLAFNVFRQGTVKDAELDALAAVD